MKTTGINKTVYRCNSISNLDSFTSVRNVLAWEMFQDRQVRNYEGVINDLQRLYPEVDFGSVTENVDPESIATDEDAIYVLVDNIINKLIESGISKDNFNYAIWACDDPENVANTYGVDIDDVSAYKITDGILLQDLGYEGQLYGVAEYPEEEWDVIESGIRDVLNIFGISPVNNIKNVPVSKPGITVKKDVDTIEISQEGKEESIVNELESLGILKFSTLSIKQKCLIIMKLIELFKLLGFGLFENVSKKEIKETLQIYFPTISFYSIYAFIFWLKGKKKSKESRFRGIILSLYEFIEKCLEDDTLLNNLNFESDRDIIISSQGGNMKTREDYKDYYLEQLIENYGDMTERDYNSAQKFCYDEEWNLGEVGNIAEAIDGLGDAWREYQKQYKEGFEIMNSKNITSALDYDKIYYNIIETANPYDRTDQWELEKYQSEDRALRKRYPKDEFVKYIDYAAEQMSGDVEQIAKYLKQIGVPNPHGQNGYIAMYTFDNLTGIEYSTRFEDWMNAVRWKDISIEEMAQEIYNAIHNIKSSKQSVKSSKAEELEMFNEESKYGNRSEFEDFKRRHPESTITYLDWRKYLNGYEDDVEYEYEDENGNMYTWDMLKKDIDDWVKNGDFKEYVGDALPDYIEPDGTPKYEKIYDDFWDIGSNGVMEYIGSSRRNNMKKNIKSSVEDVHYNRDFSQYDDAREYAEKLANKLKDITIIEDIFETKVDYYIDGKFNHSANIFSKKENYDNLIVIKYHNDIFSVSYKGSKIKSSKESNMKKTIKSGYTGTNVSVEYGPYGEEKEFPFYDMKGETVEQIDERIGYYDEVKTAWGSDGESYMILQDRADSEDKIAVLEDNYNEWVEAMSNEDYSKLLGNSRKVIKSASGSWEYQEYDMDEVEEKIGDIGISFTEPLLLADDGILYTRAGFDQWLKYLEREEGDNWADAYESYHRDTDEEFIEMCQDDFFQHDFGYTLAIYPEGLKSIAESVAEEIPSNEAPFAIPSGFAFELYPEEEEPSGFNSYWIDDMELPESFIWGINPSLGDRFDVIIDPDYLWNGTENIDSSKKGEKKKKMKIQSKRLIKSGTSNFVSNDGNFPLVVYIAENYIYDEETDSDTEERDYDADQWEYEDAVSNAESLAEDMNIYLSEAGYRRGLNGREDYSTPYNVGITSGYYEGIQIQIEDNGSFDPEYMARDDYDYTHDDSFYDLPQEEQDRLTSETEEKLVKEQEDKINDFLNELCTGYGWIKLGVSARFSNGETIYTRIDNSRKPVKSGLSFRQAVQNFKAAGHWSDYWEMQQDWEAYKDGLERDGVISEKTRSTWGNPCTPESFKRWNN